MDTQKSGTNQDWHPADVVSALRKKGTSLRQIGLANGYTHIQAVLVRPWWVVEQLVAAAIEKKPADIWPTRYAENVSREHAKRLTRNTAAFKRAVRLTKKERA